MTASAVHTSPASVALREVAAEDPNKIALEIDEHRVTYEEFNDQADRLAQRLIAEVGSASDRIALRANGTHELAVGFLGIQRAGMVAVPIDPTAPVDRLQTILADVEPSLLLSDVEGDAGLGLSAPTFHPLTFGAELEAIPIDRDRGELVSIVYTSGSTGVPKGIMMGREQMSRLFAGLPRYQVPVGARLGGLTAGTVSYIEQLIGGVFVLRGTLVAYEIRRHGLAALGEWLQNSGIAAFATVPTVLRYLLPTLSPEQHFPSVRTVVLSGETATWEDVTKLRRHLSPEAVIINGFGLTETSGIASLIITSDTPAGQGSLPAGTLSPDMDVAILDEQGQPVAQGERGEIVVQSDALALGYWRRPDLTRAAFRELADGRREVRTGDAGRLLADGTLEHLGRLDHLVKISGNRVELGEVEAELTRIDGVVAAAAAPYIDDTQNIRLAACVVPADDGGVDPRAIRASLARRLPGYMIPDHIAVVSALPQLPGGKVDRSRVAEIPASDQQRNKSPESSRSNIERALESIWQEILQLGHVDRHDDFFQIGGDSMRAARMFVELDRRLGIDLPVSLLAEAPTLASLALMLSDDDSAWNSLLPIRTDGSLAPLFVVHEGVGNVLYARGLAAELGADQPIYGLRCEGLNGAPPSEASIEELAATYVQRIQALYPDGPYQLYGASLGGAIALEMGRQLLESGKDVPLVALGDSSAPGSRLIPLTQDQRRAIRHRDLRQMNIVQRLRHVVFLTKRHLHWRRTMMSDAVRAGLKEEQALDRALQRGEPIPVLLRGRYVLRIYGRMLAAHVARPPFPERVVLLRADGPDESPDRGWEAVFGTALQIVDVPGTHADLSREASCFYVGPVLKRALAGLDPVESPVAPTSAP